MIRNRRSLRGVVLSLCALLVLSGCAAPALKPEVLPELRAIGTYEYPYDGLQLELDPKGYRELAYRIEPAGGRDPHLAAMSTEWMPAERSLRLPFTPRAHRNWRVVLVLKHPDGEKARLDKGFTVGLPPWHVRSEPIDFAVSAGYACLWSEDLPHMVDVKTLIGYKLDLAELPPDLDKDTFIGFSATAPSIRVTLGETAHLVPGQGGGSVATLDDSLLFAGNYRFRDVVPYPRCRDLEQVEVETWEAAQVRLIDKYRFPVAASVGRVLRSEQRPKSEVTSPKATGSR